ncbi:MAG: hypothetical protein ABSC54_05740 [Smithellaceae bacterium]|jgi:hypothetical protein
MTNLALIWALFAFIFCCLAFYHFVQSRKQHPLLDIHVEKKELGVNFYNSKAEANEERVDKFIKEYNSYINDYNFKTRAANRLAGFGYIASTIVSIISFLIELKVLLIE